MEIEYAFLADAAQVSEQKLYVIGGNIDRIWAEKFPTRHPMMSLVLGLRVFPREYGREQKLEVQLCDADGNRLAQMEGGFAIDPPREDPTESTVVPFVFNILAQQFPRPGNYAFYLIINNEQKRMQPLRLLLVQPATAP